MSANGSENIKREHNCYVSNLAITKTQFRLMISSRHFIVLYTHINHERGITFLTNIIKRGNLSNEQYLKLFYKEMNFYFIEKLPIIRLGLFIIFTFKNQLNIDLSIFNFQDKQLSKRIIPHKTQ